MVEERGALRLALILAFALPAIYLLLLVHDPPPQLAGREFYWESYPIRFEEDGGVLRGPWRGKYQRVGENLICLGGWERRSSGGNMISRPMGFYRFTVNGLELRLTRALAQGRCSSWSATFPAPAP